jgi:pimeloyl-ACP methyl ester carboxylesterase
MPLFISTSVNAEVTLTHVSNGDPATPCSKVAVIFVHGLTGSQETWVNRTTRQSFSNLLAEDLTLRDKIDVYGIQYDSLWTSGEPIVEVKKALEIPLDEVTKTCSIQK